MSNVNLQSLVSALAEHFLVNLNSSYKIINKIVI